MRGRAYSATSVKDVEVGKLMERRGSQAVVLGVDVSKKEFKVTPRWADGGFERPWKAENPLGIPGLVGLIRQLGVGRDLVVAMEPSGTYGDPLRQALADAGIAVHAVSPKASHDYAEVFDGVPSQHDGKDAGVVAELSAIGKSQTWKYEPPSPSDQEMHYWVDWMDAHQEQFGRWCNRIEGWLGRHWPELCELLELHSVTLLRTLGHYGAPAAVVADPQAADRLRGWGGATLKQEKVALILTSARQTVGVRCSRVDVDRVQSYVQEALRSREQVERARGRLKELARDNLVIQVQAEAVGVPTACILWVRLGDPRNYPCGAAYRKAAGLNLKERSSGVYQGQLRISKRGSAQVRRWLYLAALRILPCPGVWQWYTAKKARDGGKSKPAIVGVMRKLMLALHTVGAKGEEFDSSRLFPQGSATRRGRKDAQPSRR